MACNNFLKNIKTKIGFFVAVTFFITSCGSKKPVVFSSPLDTNRYRYIVLENGLEVVLTESKDIKKSAAAMSVGVGSYSDPVDFQGLSHLLEHSLFLGTKEYPEKEGFAKFIGMHGGSYNAYTTSRQIEYFFDINSQNFENGLRRFSSMFSNPLFLQESVTKERNIVDSEFKLNILSSYRRMFDVVRETMDKNSIYTKLAIGNKETLKDKDTKVSTALKRFFNQNYHAKNLKLAISSSLNLKVQEELVRKIFSTIKTQTNKNISTKKKEFKSLFVAKTSLPRIISVKQIDDKKKIMLMFQVQSQERKAKTQPLNYMLHVLGDESKGSLLEGLREDNLAMNLSSSIFKDNGNIAFVGVNIELTNHGAKQWHKVVGAVLLMVDKIKASDNFKIMEQNNSLYRLNFITQDSAEPMQVVKNIASNMQTYPIKNILVANNFAQEINHKDIKEANKEFDDNNLQIIYLNKNIATNLQSQWYKTDYFVKGISIKDLQKWRKLANDLVDGFNIQTKNPFIFSLSKEEIIKMKPEEEYLSAIPNKDFVDKKENIIFVDTNIDKLKGEITAWLDVSYNSLSKKKQIVSEILAQITNIKSKKIFYNAEIANVHINIASSKRGVILTASGYRNKQNQLLNLYINSFKKLDITKLDLSEAKNKIIKQVKSLDFVSPAKLATQNLYTAMLKNSISRSDYLRIVPSISVGDLVGFRKEILSSAKFQALVVGQYSLEQKREIKNFGSRWEKRDDSKHFSQPRILPQLKTITHKFISKHNDNAVVLYKQFLSKTSVDKASVILLASLMKNKFFTSLRTQKEIGYVVNVSYHPIADIDGISFLVQSNKMHSKNILSEINNFIANFDFSKTNFEIHRKALENKMQINPKPIAMQAYYYAREVNRGNFDFNFRKNLYKAVRNVKESDVRNALLLLKKEKGRRVIINNNNIGNATGL